MPTYRRRPDPDPDPDRYRCRYRRDSSGGGHDEPEPATKKRRRSSRSPPRSSSAAVKRWRSTKPDAAAAAATRCTPTPPPPRRRRPPSSPPVIAASKSSLAVVPAEIKIPLPVPDAAPPALIGRCILSSYERVTQIGRGAHGAVYRATHKETGEIVAIKRVNLYQGGGHLLSLAELREMKGLNYCRHPNVIELKHILCPDEDERAEITHVYLVMEFADQDLSSRLASMADPFTENQVRDLMRQLIRALAHLHAKGVLHRDIKPSNLLLTWQDTLKIGDFGLCRPFHGKPGPYTQPVTALWYRAPELMMGVPDYSAPIDMWSAGCVMAELLSKQPLFAGNTDVEQLANIFRLLGAPREATWPGFSNLPGAKTMMSLSRSSSSGGPIRNRLRDKFHRLSSDGFRLLSRLLTCNPNERITAEAAMWEPWFADPM